MDKGLAGTLPGEALNTRVSGHPLEMRYLHRVAAYRECRLPKGARRKRQGAGKGKAGSHDSFCFTQATNRRNPSAKDTVGVQPRWRRAWRMSR